jgi:choline-sulfatase
MAQGDTRQRSPRRRGPAVALAAAVVVVAAVAWWFHAAGPSRSGGSGSSPPGSARERSSRVVPATEARLGDLVHAGDAKGMNVLLVTLDTVRADRLGCYGYEGAETPTLDSLARRGVRFDDAVTSVPLTLPSHATILTGLSPLSHGVHDNGTYRLAEDHVTLAEALKAHGYDTAAFVGCFVVDARFGLDQGFDRYDFDVPSDGYRPQMLDFNERSADHVTDAVLEWLDARDGPAGSTPFFAWVHYFDAHQPYRSPLQRLTRFASRPYDAEIAYVDIEFGRLLGELNERGKLDNTLIVVAADHGEALGEHDEQTHGMLLYEPTLHVPLIISNASLFDGAYKVSDRVVGLVDLRPTVEDLLGIAEAGQLDGESLLGTHPDADRAVYIETEMPLDLAGWSPLRGLRTHTQKYILAPEPELYDLQSDPNETKSLYAWTEPTAARLSARLSEVLAQSGRSSAPAHKLSDEERQRLSSLGYLQAGATPPGGPLPDPKDMMSVYNDAVKSENLYGQGDYEGAAALAGSVLERSDMLLQALRVLAFSDIKLGRPDEAVELLREATAKNPDVFLIRSLAQALIIDGRYEEALDTLDLYASVSPEDGRVPLLRGDIYTNQGDDKRAMEAYERAIRIDEHRVGIQARQRIARLSGS